VSELVRLAERKSLQELVQARMDTLELTARGAAYRSDGLVSYETIRNIMRGRHGGVVSDRVAQGLAKALQVPVERIYTAMQVPQPVGEWHLPSELHRLPPEYRAKVEDVARVLLAAYEHGFDDGAAARETRLARAGT